MTMSSLSFAPDINSTYHFVNHCTVYSTVAATGARPGFTWPANLTYGVVYMTSPATTATTTTLSVGNHNANVVSVSTGVPILNQPYLHKADGTLVTKATTTGNLTVGISSETGGTTVTLGVGSFLAYRKIA